MTLNCYTYNIKVVVKVEFNLFIKLFVFLFVQILLIYLMIKYIISIKNIIVKWDQTHNINS